MSMSLLKGKRFYCREWAFSKVNHCLENRTTAKTCGALIMAGPGCGKTALCSELVWPTTAHGKQNYLNRFLMAYHFCQAHDIDSLSIEGFIKSLVAQIAESDLIEGYRELRPAFETLLESKEIEQNPDEVFRKTVLQPLDNVEVPSHNLLIVIDSIDESYLQTVNEKKTTSKTIAELIANNHHLVPKWLLLLCSARKQSKLVTRMFTGFRKISLDDLRKSNVVRDVQQYILCRLDQEEALRSHLSRDTAEMLNQLHIKSNGCFLYLEKVLDGVAENFIMLREIKEIPGTLNGLYLWLCQRLFIRKQFAKIQSILNAMLAARRPLSLVELYACAWSRNSQLTPEEFKRRMGLLGKVLINGEGKTRILFHHSFAEWLLDVKHCTLKYLCNAAEGHGTLAMYLSLKSKEGLVQSDIHELALHLSKSILQPPVYPYHMALWMVMCGVEVENSLTGAAPKEQKVRKLLREAGAKLTNSGDETQSNSASSVDKDDPLSGLLEDDSMLNQIDGNGRTLLMNASYQGNLPLVMMLVARQAELEVVDKNGQTALNLAARQGYVEIVDILLKNGAKVDHTDMDGWSALRSASWGGHSEVVGLLLEADADVDLADSDQRTALRAASWGGHEEIVLNLIRHNAQINLADNEGRTALIAASYMGHSEIVELLLGNGAGIDHEDNDGRTALSVAALCAPASQGHATVISLLLDKGATVDHSDHDGMTPLLVAAFEGHFKVCELLLENEADVDHTDRAGRTPIIAAASMGHASIVSLLLFWGAAIDTIDIEGRTVLCVAASQGNADVVLELLDRGLDEMHRDNSGLTPLHLAAFEGHVEASRRLVESGAKVNEIDNEGRHALILAAQEGHTALVGLLLLYSSDMEHKAHDGKNAFRVAAFEGHKDVVGLLIEKGSDVNYKDADGRSTLYVLALENRVSMAGFLIEKGADLEACDLEGRTALHVAAWQGHSEMVVLLLEHRAKINATDNDARTPLQSAAWQGHMDIVRILLDHGANVNHMCNQGATALCISAQEGHEGVVRTLLQYGADPNHADQFGRTPMRVAVKGQHENVIKILEEFGATFQQNIRQLNSGQPAVVQVQSTNGHYASYNNNNHHPPNHSPLVSPESNDHRKSFISNVSSKSSSNLTSNSSSIGRQMATQTEPGQLSFTQQLQQCSAGRKGRPVSRLLTPVSEPHSPVHSPVASPFSEIHSVMRLSPEHQKFTSTPNPSAMHVTPRKEMPPVHIIMNPNAEFLTTQDEPDDEPVWQINSQLRAAAGRNRTKVEVQRREPAINGKPAMGQVALIMKSPEVRRKNNGIITNPTYGLVNIQPPNMNGYINKLAHLPDNLLNENEKRRNMSKKQHRPAQRPTGLAIKKETPL